MKDIIFCTTNKEKLAQAQYVFKDYFNIIGKKLDIPEIQSLNQKEIAIDKARKAFEILKQPVIVDDSGFFVKKYNNFPGVLTKFIYEAIDIPGFLKLVDQDDECYFETFAVYKDANKEICVSGRMEGNIEKENIGHINPAVPYRAIFKVKELNGKLFEICSDEEIKNISHRGKAFQELKNLLS